MANQTVENNDEMCLFKEVKGDLFSCSYRSSMATCVSEEFKMGRGISVMFKKQFGHVEDLWNQDKRVGQVAILKDNERYIYYLVTKQYFYDKPSYQSLGWSLVDMRNHCLKHGVKELSMPRIGCGLDLLEWTEVSAMIKEIFTGTGISITIYNWVDKEEKQEVVNQDQSGSSSNKKKKRKKNKNKGKTRVDDVNGDDGDDDNEQQSDRPPRKSNFNSQERTQGVVDPSENRGKWDRRPSVAEEDSFIVFSDEPENRASRTPHFKAKSMDDDDKQLLPDVPENWDTTEASGISDGQKNELAQEDQHVIKDGKRTSNDSKPNLEPKSKNQRIKGKDTKSSNEEWKTVGDKKLPSNGSKKSAKANVSNGSGQSPNHQKKASHSKEPGPPNKEVPGEKPSPNAKGLAEKNRSPDKNIPNKKATGSKPQNVDQSPNHKKKASHSKEPGPPNKEVPGGKPSPNAKGLAEKNGSPDKNIPNKKATGSKPQNVDQAQMNAEMSASAGHYDEEQHTQPNEIKEGRKETSQLSCDGQVNRVEASSHPNPDSSRHKVERDQADNQTNPIDQVEKPKSAAQQQSISKVGEGNLQPSVNSENHNKDNSRQQQIGPSQAEKGKESGTSKPFGGSSTGKPRGRGSAGGQSGGKGQNKRVGSSRS